MFVWFISSVLVGTYPIYCTMYCSLPIQPTVPTCAVVSMSPRLQSSRTGISLGIAAITLFSTSRPAPPNCSKNAELGLYTAVNSCVSLIILLQKSKAPSAVGSESSNNNKINTFQLCNNNFQQQTCLTCPMWGSKPMHSSDDEFFTLALSLTKKVLWSIS